MMKGDLWDDSALTDAFDQAISKYKKMHVKGFEESSSGCGGTKAEEQGLDAFNTVETNDGSTHLINTIEDEAEKLPFAKENETLDFQASEEYVQVPNGAPLHNHTQGYSSSQGLEEYNLLWKQYYEVEEKRLQIWEKLQQYGHSDPSYPAATSGSCTLGPADSAFQDQYYSSQGCYPTYAVVCCSNVCQSSTTSCSLPSCTLSASAGQCINSSLATNSGIVSGDVDIVKKGMEAVEKAISSLKQEASDCQLKDQSGSQTEPITNGETDLTEVLSAWYSAGFYTAKYLTEKSLAKPRNS